MQKRDNFLSFSSPVITQEEIDEVVDSLKNGWLTTGPKVAKFEQLFKNYIGSNFTKAVNSCTAALHLSLICNNISKNDEVIIPSLTFAATANVVCHVGATPVFSDVSLPSATIDVKDIEKRITKKTKAIIPVHYTGMPCDMKAIMQLAEANNLIVIEDCAHAIEAKIDNQFVGTFGKASAFSFYATKNVITGEGGMFVTDDEELSYNIEIYSLHGMSKGAWKRFSNSGFKHYEIMCPGFKYNMMDIQAAIGIHQIQKVEDNLKIRERIWKKYNDAFKDLLLELPAEPKPNDRHARHLYTILPKIEYLNISRDQLLQELIDLNIGASVHYITLHLHPFYRNSFHYRMGDFPNSEYISERTISLPLTPFLSEKDTDDVIEAVTYLLKKHQK